MERQRDRATWRQGDGATGRFCGPLTTTPSLCLSFNTFLLRPVAQSPRRPLFLFLCLAALLSAGCGSGLSSAPSISSSITVPPASPVPANTDGSEQAIRFLEDRVKRDPDDFIALNKLAGYYMLRDRKSTRLNSSHLGISYAVF